MQTNKTEVPETQVPEHLEFPMIPALRQILESLRDETYPAGYYHPLNPEDKHYSEKRDALDNLDRYEEDVKPLVRILYNELYDACVENRDFCESNFTNTIPKNYDSDTLYKGAMDAEAALLYINAINYEVFNEDFKTVDMNTGEMYSTQGNIAI